MGWAIVVVSGPAVEGPKRIQLRRTKGWRKPDGAIVVSRPSKWGNPWTGEADEVVALYRRWVVAASGPVDVADVRRELAGRDLACWCALDVPCHADVLLEIANRPSVQTGEQP